MVSKEESFTDVIILHTTFCFVVAMQVIPGNTQLSVKLVVSISLSPFME